VPFRWQFREIEEKEKVSLETWTKNKEMRQRMHCTENEDQ
jgi:hypothetical protein